MIIGINGKAGSGKDTAADIIAKEFNLEKISFAGKIKNILEDVFDFPQENLWGPSEFRSKPLQVSNGEFINARDALQIVGEAFCEVYEDVWIDYVFKKHSNNLIIVDQRKRNEFNSIKNKGGLLIRIKREGAGLQGKNAQHRSEVEMDTIKDEEYDIVIENNSSLEELRDKLKERIIQYIL